MAPNVYLPPTFSTDPGPLPSRPPPAPLRAYNRVHTQVDFKNTLSNLTLDGKNYYKPNTTNNPLFDSFTIDCDCEKRAAMISIFQITISEDHRGSSKGYDHIKAIMGRVRELLGAGKPATIKVTYFLVCPESEKRHRWQMPGGWKKDISGDVFCVRVPASTHHGMLYLYTPNSAT